MTTAHNPDALSQALAEPSRRAILENLRFGQKSVSELVVATGLKQPNVSNHLAKMRVQNIVHAERIGRQVYYSIAMPVADLLLRLHEYTSESLRSDQEREAGEHADFIQGEISEQATGLTSFGNGQEGSEGSTDLSTAVPLAEWRTEFFRSILAGHEDRAGNLVNDMLARRVRMTDIYTEVFQWAINRVGELYQQGVTDEAHEHLASALTERMMARVAQFYTPVARSSRRAVLGCVAGNWHAMGLRMLSDSLRTHGWDTLYLGANVPTPSFLSMTTSVRPDLVVISCTMEDQVMELRKLVEHLHAARTTLPDLDFKIMVGGQYINMHPEILQEINYDYTARDLPHFLKAMRELGIVSASA